MPAQAQNYPDRVVKVINPFPAGGSVDITARMMSQKLSELTGQQFVVENRGGAGGNTGADAVAKSDPDGYTLLFTAPGPLVTNPTLFTKGLPFDPNKDFTPIAIFAITPIVLMVNPALPINNVQELIAYAKANPGKVNFGSAGVGSTPHLSGELFKNLTKRRDHPRALSRHGAGDERPDRRPHPDVLRSAARQPAANQRRQGARHRQRRRQARRRRCRTCRPSPSRACPASIRRPGSRWSRRRRRRAPVVAKLRADVDKAIKSPGSDQAAG